MRCRQQDSNDTQEHALPEGFRTWTVGNDDHCAEYIPCSHQSPTVHTALLDWLESLSDFPVSVRVETPGCSGREK